MKPVIRARSAYAARTLYSHSLLFLAIAQAVPALAAEAAAGPGADNRLGTVVVVGNRGQARTLADSPSPVDVISSSQLEATGQGDLTRALSRVLPSLNLPASSGSCRDKGKIHSFGM
ncbi:hypothetical protein [Pseudomonas aeruginosa]|uniref:hypothetical protein n=1 Tax=Pseudomonas aeruginosa TaxID=287 RepID=UPI00053EEBAE|nr:hypothetical protein [Pseudomonas aeruginosa]